ncbi:MAG: peptide deformylase [Spirochaetales bacterium]
MELHLVLHPDELLRGKSEKVTDINDEIVALTEAMIEKMHAARGIGLAGVQVGYLHRLFVVHVDGDKPRVFINPSIVETSVETVDYDEGCLSIPAIYADVRRPQAVRVQAWNERGRPFNLDADGLLARVIQHEYDHLNGVLFIDHLDEQVRDTVMADYDPSVDPASASRR